VRGRTKESWCRIDLGVKCICTYNETIQGKSVFDIKLHGLERDN
jgi:hypothetical protein